MIKFFRKIRERLLTENPSYTKASAGTKLSKYLLYAIGEIVLVMIGILIALQVNNSNTERLYTKREISLITDLKESIYQDSLVLLNLQDYKLKEVSESINVLKTLPEYNDSLKYHFDNLRSTLLIRMDRSIYDDIKSTGLDILSNNSLKQEIIQFYQFCYFLEYDADNEVNKFAINKAEAFLLENFYRVDCKNKACWAPKDYLTLVSDKDYMTILLEKERTNDYGKQLIKLGKDYMSAIMRKLEKELKEIDN